jgi:hypothetical protein
MPAFNWLLILLIPLTLSWKLMAEPPAANETQANIARFLAKQKFKVTEEPLVGGAWTVMRATKGDCSMLVAEASVDGSMRNLIRRDVRTSLDRSFVVFRGHVYHEHPTWLMVTQHWWMGLLRKLGMSHTEAPPIMVAATRSCGAERLPWTQLWSEANGPMFRDTHLSARDRGPGTTGA